MKPGHANPSQSAAGLLVLGQAVSEFVGNTQFSARDLEDDALLNWLTDLERAIPDFDMEALRQALEETNRPGSALATDPGTM